MGYSVKKIAQDSQVNMILSTVKRLKFKIKAHGSIIKKKDQEDLKSYQRFIINYILKLIADSPFNILNNIALKSKNNYEVEVHRSTISWVLVENWL